MATPEALRGDVMTLVRHLAAEHRRVWPSLFVSTVAAPNVDEAVAAARYELCAVRRILSALAPVEVLRREVDEIDPNYEPDEEYLGAFHACELRETVLGKIDEGLIARVTADVERDARIAPPYRQLVEIALTVAHAEYTDADESILMHDVPSELIHDLPIVFPRFELGRKKATLELSIKLGEVSSDTAYVDKWESRRSEGLERIVRVGLAHIAEGRLFAFARSKGVERLWVAGAEMPLDDDAMEAQIVAEFWDPSASLWGDFAHSVGTVWESIVKAQIQYLRAASRSHPQFAARSVLPYPRTLRAARSTAGRRPARYEE